MRIGREHWREHITIRLLSQNGQQAVGRGVLLAFLASAAMRADRLIDYAPGEYVVTDVPIAETILSTCYVWGGQRFEAERVVHPLRGIGFQYSA